MSACRMDLLIAYVPSCTNWCYKLAITLCQRGCVP